MSEVAKLRLNPDGSVLVELDAAATEEDEAVALAVAEAMCAEFNHIGDEDDEDDILDFMRERSAQKPSMPRRARPEPVGARQLMLLTGLDDLPDQTLMWE